MNYAGPVLIASRFCGPPSSGNGGYTAGLLAAALGGSVEVTLRSPPRLEHELDLQVTAGHARLTDGEVLVAEARRVDVELQLPAPATFEQATVLSRNYVGFRQHHFPGCFVCGAARAPAMACHLSGQDRPGEPVAAPSSRRELFDERQRLNRESCGPRSIAWATSRSRTKYPWHCLAG